MSFETDGVSVLELAEEGDAVEVLARGDYGRGDVFPY